MILLAIFLGVIGAVLVNGLADNLAREETVPLSELAFPRCTYCGAPRKLRDGSAVLASLFHGGGCLRCGAPRPFRDLLVEAILWIGFPAVWLAGNPDLPGLLIGGLILSSFVLFTVIDFEHRIVVVEAVALVSLLLLLGGWARGSDTLLRMLGGGAIGFAIFLVLFFLGWILALLLRLGQGIEPLGFGDVILAALVGFVVGWPSILFAAFVSVFLGGIVGLILSAASILRKRPLRNATMAYGPYLMIAGLLVYFFGGQLLGGVMYVISFF